MGCQRRRSNSKGFRRWRSGRSPATALLRKIRGILHISLYKPSYYIKNLNKLSSQSGFTKMDSEGNFLDQNPSLNSPNFYDPAICGIGFLLGQRSSSNPSAMLAALLCKRTKLHEELRSIEKQVHDLFGLRENLYICMNFLSRGLICVFFLQLYDMETGYLQDPSQCGNVLKGFEGFLSSSKSTTL